MHSLLIGIAEQVNDDAFGARITGSAGYYDLNRKPRTFGKEGRNKEVKSSLRDARDEIIVVVTWPGKCIHLMSPTSRHISRCINEPCASRSLPSSMCLALAGRQGGKEVRSRGLAWVRISQNIDKLALVWCIQRKERSATREGVTPLLSLTYSQRRRSCLWLRPGPIPRQRPALDQELVRHCPRNRRSACRCAVRSLRPWSSLAVGKRVELGRSSRPRRDPSRGRHAVFVSSKPLGFAECRRGPIPRAWGTSPSTKRHRGTQVGGQ